MSADELRAELARLQRLWQALDAPGLELDCSDALKPHLRRLFSGDMLWTNNGEGAGRDKVEVTLEVEGDGDEITSAFVLVERAAVEAAACKVCAAVLDDTSDRTALLCKDHKGVVDSGVVACGQCGEPVTGKGMSAMGQTYHESCFSKSFVCTVCSKPLQGFVTVNGKLYCPDHNPEGSLCAGCRKPLARQVIAALDQKWHPSCFVCEECKKPFESGLFFKVEGKPYCAEHAMDDSSEDDGETLSGASQDTERGGD